MDHSDIIYGIIIGLLTEIIVRVIDSRGKIKEKFLTPFLRKLSKKKSKTEVYVRSNPPVVVACAKCKSAYGNSKGNTFFTFAEGKIFDKE